MTIRVPGEYVEAVYKQRLKTEGESNSVLRVEDVRSELEAQIRELAAPLLPGSTNGERGRVVFAELAEDDPFAL